MTKLFSCQVKAPQPLADCGDRSIRNGKKDRVTCPNQCFHIVKLLRASPCRRFLGRSFVPAVIAGHWNAALDKKLPQGEANFSRSKESYLHSITVPFQGRVTRGVPRRSSRPAGNMPVQFPIRNTIRLRSVPEPGRTNAAIVSSAPTKVKDSFLAFFQPSAQPFPRFFGKVPQKKKNRRAAYPGKGQSAARRRSSVTVFPGAAGTGAWQSPSGLWRSRGAGTWGSSPPGAPGPSCLRP